MGFAHGLRQLANKVFRRDAANDNLNFKLDDKQLKRTLDAPNDNTVETLHGVKVADPFRPLEKIDAKETADWLARQQKQFADFISDAAGSIEAAKSFMTEATTYSAPSMPARYGGTWFRTINKSKNGQAVIEVSSSAEGPWETLLDPNTLSADGTVAISDWFPSPDGKRVAYMVSEAGSDAQTLKIFDVGSKKDLPDVINDCRFTTVLWDRGSHDSFQYTYPTHDGTRRKVTKHHAIGADAAQDKTVFESATEDSFASPWRMKTAKYEWMWLSIGTDKNHGLLFRPFGSTEAFTEVLAPQKTTLTPVIENDDGTILALTTLGAPRGRIVRMDPRDPAPEKWETVIAEHPADKLGSAMVHQGRLFAFYSHDTADAVRVFTPEGQHLHDMPLPIQSVASYARIHPEDTTFTMKISSFKTPGDIYTYDIEKNELSLVRKSNARHDLNDCIVERIHTVSKDGTKVPMTVIRHPDTQLDGTAALKLYGYGGFNIALGPAFSAAVMHFVKAGGIYVQTNLRGGGEFGSDWYDGGRLDNKQNVFDDFIACAEHLIASGYTSKDRLVSNGGSNGGLLTSATMLQRPDLFGAVITEVAVTDMFRFHLATYGSAWKSDYGDVSIRKDFNTAAKYSPLHNVREGAKYPPHLIKTGSHDDRVLPWHSFKLAATLQAKSHKDNITLLRVEDRAGHGAGKPLYKYIQEYAETFAFIEKTIGPVNQKAYKAKLAAESAQKKQKKKFWKFGS